jgi:hypothetical protein
MAFNLSAKLFNIQISQALLAKIVWGKLKSLSQPSKLNVQSLIRHEFKVGCRS